MTIFDPFDGACGQDRGFPKALGGMDIEAGHAASELEAGALCENDEEMLVDDQGCPFEFGIGKGGILPAKGISWEELTVLAKIESDDGTGRLGIETGAGIPCGDRRADSGKEKVVVASGGGSR